MKLVIQVEFDDSVTTYSDAAKAITSSLETAQRKWVNPSIDDGDSILFDGVDVGKWDITGDAIDDFLRQLA